MSSWIVWVALVAVFVGFWIWYGGSGAPLAPGEADALLARMRAGGERRGHVDEELIEAFRTLAEDDDGREFYMVNLMRHREKAQYPPGSPYDDDVQAAADRYNRAVVPALLKRGSHPILLANVLGTFLEPEGSDRWDQVGIVRYRSRRDMLDMAIELGEGGGGAHKWASIEKTHVFPARPVVDLVFVRATVAALLALVGVALTRLLR